MCQILTDRAHQLVIEEVHHRLGGIVGKMVPILDMRGLRPYRHQEDMVLIRLSNDLRYHPLFQIWAMCGKYMGYQHLVIMGLLGQMAHNQISHGGYQNKLSSTIYPQYYSP